MGSKTLLQFAHDNMQQQLHSVTKYKQLPHQQPRIRFALFGKKSDNHQKTKRRRPRLEQPESFDGKANVTSINGIVVINDGQRTDQQQQHDDVV
ncbi:hypothetical protein D3C79_872470 [compost metagenome]